MNEDRISHDAGRGSSALMAFALGTAIGAGVALLLAPASGSETRRRIREASRRWGSNVRDGVDEARGRLGELRDDTRAAMTAGREAFAREREAHSHSHSQDRS